MIAWLDMAAAGPQRGRVAELLVAAYLTARGYVVSFTNPDASYDLVAEHGDKRMFRIQVKAAYQSGKKEIFSTSRARPHHAPRLAYKPDDFDYFAVVSSQGIFFVEHDEETPISSRTVSVDMATEPGM